jgi:hypothetical protein
MFPTWGHASPLCGAQGELRVGAQQRGGQRFAHAARGSRGEPGIFQVADAGGEAAPEAFVGEQGAPAFEGGAPHLVVGGGVLLRRRFACRFQVEHLRMFEHREVVQGNVADALGTGHAPPCHRGPLFIALAESGESLVVIAAAERMGPEPEELVDQANFGIVETLQRGLDGLGVRRRGKRQRACRRDAAPELFGDAQLFGLLHDLLRGGFHRQTGNAEGVLPVHVGTGGVEKNFGTGTRRWDSGRHCLISPV